MTTFEEQKKPTSRTGRMLAAVTASLALVLTACTASGEAGDTACAASASLQGPDGAALGSVEVVETARGALVRARLQGLPPGVHALHLHEKGQCNPDFGSAGGHFNPTGVQHGYLNPEGHHLGDLPNFSAADSGAAFVDVFIPGLRVCDGDTRLLDDDGAAVIIHRGTDDYRTDPAGAAGERIACGALAK